MIPALPSMTLMNPGPAGWLIGILLLSLSVRLLLGLRRRRRASRAAAARAACGWHPSQGPRPRPQVDSATVLLPRVCDQLDATILIPRQPGVRRG